MVYPEKIVRALEKRRHAQSVSDPNAVGAAADFACGTFIRFGLSIDVDRRLVINASFSSNGCGFRIAAAQALADRVTARSLSELHGLSDAELNAGIRTDLGRLPDDRLKCVTSAIEALRKAFSDLRARQIEEFRGEKALICTCFGVTEEAIETLITNGAVASIDEVALRCNAGSGCGSCRMLIQEMLDLPHSDLSCRPQ